MKRDIISRVSRVHGQKNLKIFEELMTHNETVFHICLGFAKNIQDAEELAQEVYLKASRKIDTLKNSRLSREWLFQIARNTCLDHMKRKRLVRFLPLESDDGLPDTKTPEFHTLQSQQLQILKKAISSLPKKLREVFVLREYGDLSYEEIASALGIKEGTVMSKLNQARRELMKRVKEAEHEKKGI